MIQESYYRALISAEKAPRGMKANRQKLHPATCFPPNPSEPSTQNRLFIRVAPSSARASCPRLTFIGINASTYSTIVALLVSRPGTPIDAIKLFDIGGQREARATLHDLQVVASLSKTRTRLEWVQSFWETKGSTIIVIHVQHHRLENESTSKWIQTNATLIETVVSQLRLHSPDATLLICTQPNELMTYVAWRVSRFPRERVFGLGASVTTAYAHRRILEENRNIHGRVNGWFHIGSESVDGSCAEILFDHLTIEGLRCSDIYRKSTMVKSENTGLQKEPLLAEEWNLMRTLNSGIPMYSTARRRPPIVTDVASRQRTVTRHLLCGSCRSPSLCTDQTSIPTPSAVKGRSNWAEAMLIVRTIQALTNDKEFQSNFAVNVASINNSKDVVINYPTIIGSSHRGVEYLFPFTRAEETLRRRFFLVGFERSQNSIGLWKSKD